MATRSLPGNSKKEIRKEFKGVKKILCPEPNPGGVPISGRETLDKGELTEDQFIVKIRQFEEYRLHQAYHLYRTQNITISEAYEKAHKAAIRVYDVRR